MQFTPETFLSFVKNIVLGTNAAKTTNGVQGSDGGYKQDVGISLGDLALGSTSVLVTDANGLRMISTGVSSTQGSTNTFGTFNWIVPRDYDHNSDFLLVRAVAAMSGNTDTPTITATSSTILPAGTINASDTLNTTATLTAGSTVVGSTVTAIAAGVVTLSATLSSTHAIYEFPMSGLGLIRDTEVVLKLTTGTHNTDKTELYAVEIVYASALVASKESFNLAGKAIGYDAFLEPLR